MIADYGPDEDRRTLKRDTMLWKAAWWIYFPPADSGDVMEGGEWSVLVNMYRQIRTNFWPYSRNYWHVFCVYWWLSNRYLKLRYFAPTLSQAQSLFAVCKALKAGMAGLFGPQSSSTSSHVQSICDTLEIPHIETRWDYRMKREDYSVNLYPHPHALGQVRRGFFLIYGSFLFCCQCCQIGVSSFRPTRPKH